MSVFKKNLHSSGAENTNAGAAAAVKMEFTRRLVFTGVALILACLAVFSYISRAWFASNKDVAAENASVTSESGTASLFIRQSSDMDLKYYSLVSTNWGNAPLNTYPLYPISTADCENWYYISDWAMVLTEHTGTGITTGEYYASGYTKANDISNGIYTGYANQTRRAYYCSQYNLYTDKSGQNMDVYLHPDNPIEISFGDSEEEREKNQGLMEAIRVAIVGADSTIIYAPEAESGIGKNYITYNATNKIKASPNTFYAVTGTDTATEQAILHPTKDEGGNVTDDGLNGYKGVAVDGDLHSFTAGTTRICTATPATPETPDTPGGTNVSVYVWLEGMDAQGIINVADGRTISVKLNFVGVPVTVTP